MKDFDDFNEKFYNKIEKHKNKLVEKLMNNPDNDVCISFFDCANHYESFIDEVIQERQKGLGANKYTLMNYSRNELYGSYLTFQEGKSREIHASFFCLQFFDLYRIIHNGIQRYVYFEIYFDDKTLGVLMRKSKFNESNLSLPCFDLDRREWAEAKIQMRMWGQYIRPKMDEIYEIPAHLESIIDELKEANDDWIDKTDASYQKTIEALFAQPFLWPIMAYAGIVALSPFIQSQYIPSHTLNLYHQDDSSDYLVQLLRSYLKYFSLGIEAYKNEDIMVVDQLKSAHYQAAESEFAKYSEQINLVLFPYSNTSATQDCARALNLFANSKRRNKLVSYPLKSIPLLIGKGALVSSAYLNLEVDTQTLSRLKNDPEYVALLPNFRTIFLQEISCYLGDKSKIDELDSYDLIKRFRNNLDKRYCKSEKYWQNMSKKFPCLPGEYLALARWLSVFMDKPGTYLKGANAQQSLVHKMLLESLQQQNQLFESQQQNLTSFLRGVLGSIDTFPTERPELIKTFNSSLLPYHTTIGDLPLILYPRELLKEELRKNCSATPPEELIKDLKAKGLLHTNKDVYTCNWKIESGVKTYALHIQNLKEYLEKFAIKSEVTEPVPEKIGPITPKMKKSKKSKKS